MNRLTIQREIVKRNSPLRCLLKDSDFIRSELFHIDSAEQECHFNDERTLDFIHVCCSNQLWLTKLKKNPRFTVTNVLYAPDYRILQLIGHLPKNFLSVKTKIRGGK